MNQKKLNKNIADTQLEDTTESTMQQCRDKGLSYKLEIMDDENIYSVSFEGKLTEKDTKKILSEIRNCLYENTAGAIQKYLEQNNLVYSGFVSTRKPLKHTIVMEFAELFLNSGTCNSLDKYIGGTDIFCAIADHQKWISENCCQGCYFAVKIAHPIDKGLYQYHIIGQTFNYDETTGDESGYFAIRTNRDDGYLDNIVISDSEPVLSSFGCIDMLGILLNIDSIQTVEQIEKIAVK